MDVHPPLAKLLITLAAHLSGFNGQFDFSDIANEYLVPGDMPGQPVPYVAMRAVAAVAGWLLVPIAFVTLRAAGVRTGSALVGAAFVLWDNALATQSHYILLDAPLVLFTAMSALAWICFSREDARLPFTRLWWAWLIVTGASLGLVLSVKWVGLFTVATIGVATVLQLWFRLADRRTSLWGLWRHFCARVLGLIVVPLTVYAATFWIHFAVLNRSGDGDGFMTPQFQHTLRGREMPDTYAQVALGSAVTIRHIHTRGGYLHSHPYNYEKGSKQQQITLYPHEDDNNVWEVVAAPPANETAQVDEKGVPITLPPDSPRDVDRHLTQLDWLKDKTEVRLVHRASDKRLHSHNVRAPITEADYQHEVSAYGSPGFTGDGNDDWVVEIDRTESPPGARDQVYAIRTVFRLRHLNSGCYLFSHNVNLPEWGFGQQEVTCNQWPTRPNTLFYMETNAHPLLVADPHSKRANYPMPSFLAKFVELQKVMWTTNAGLTARHVYQSRPGQWPLLRRGVNYWSKQHRQVYLLGNPFVWFVAFAAVLAYTGARVLAVLRMKRGHTDLQHAATAHYDAVLALFVTGYALHYLPFFAMQRQLFLHHYLPALYWGILTAAVVTDACTARLRARTRLVLTAALALTAALVFWRLSPLTSAGRWSQAQCMAARLRSTWDLDCINFPTDIHAYSSWPGAVHSIDPASEQNRHMPPLPSLPLVPRPPRSSSSSSLSSSPPPLPSNPIPVPVPIHDHDAVPSSKTDVSDDLAAPAPGNHAFEQPAHKALESGVPVGPAARPNIHGGSGSGSGAAAAAAAAAGPHAHGLDAKQLQNVVLGGTAAKGVAAKSTATITTGTTALAV